MRTYFFILAALIFLPLLTHAQGTDFIPLTSLPGLDKVSSANSLAPFLSEIYKICIGLAAVLAVLQIMRAGVMYMGGDSITEKKDARALIGTSLAGLLLVLSPVIVFSIINPNILKLDISAGNLQSSTAGGGANAGSSASPGSTASTQSPNPAVTAAICNAATIKKAVVLASGQTCEQKFGTGYAKIDPQCCSDYSSGASCCGYDPKNDQTVAPGPNLSATASYSISFQDKDAVGKACVTTDDRGNYDSLSSCQSAFASETQTLRSRGSIFAVGKICSEASQHTPTPVDIWNKIRPLPAC
ncbi:MAG: hypothetical protein JWO84_331 [Parcubacteria group bacterium]|nr:hypothetical protein [Parcubacteria group bacterium]